MTGLFFGQHHSINGFGYGDVVLLQARKQLTQGMGAEAEGMGRRMEQALGEQEWLEFEVLKLWDVGDACH